MGEHSCWATHPHPRPPFHLSLGGHPLGTLRDGIHPSAKASINSTLAPGHQAFTSLVPKWLVGSFLRRLQGRSNSVSPLGRNLVPISHWVSPCWPGSLSTLCDSNLVFHAMRCCPTRHHHRPASTRQTSVPLSSLISTGPVQHPIRESFLQPPLNNAKGPLCSFFQIGFFSTPNSCWKNNSRLPS